MSVHMAFHTRGCFASFSLFPSAAPFPLSSWARMHLHTPMMDGRSVEAQSATAGSLKFRVSFLRATHIPGEQKEITESHDCSGRPPPIRSRIFVLSFSVAVTSFRTCIAPRVYL